MPHFRLLADSMPQLVWVSGPDGGIEFVNEQWFKYTGQPIGPIDREAWLDVTYPEDRDRVLAAHRQALLQKSDFQVEYRLRRKDGAYRWHLARTVFYKSADGQIIKRFGTATDIHDQKVAEEKLLRSQEQLDVILQGVSSGIIAFDASGEYVFANDVAARMSGYESTEAFLKAASQKVLEGFDLFDENGSPMSPSQLPSSRLLSGEREVPEMLVQYRAKGRLEIRWSILRTKAVLNDHGKIQYIVTIFDDFTARKRSEQATALLDEASRILASSLDYHQTFQTIAEIAVPRLGDWCSMHVLENGVPVSIAVSHPDPKKLALSEEFRLKYPPDWSGTTGQAGVLKSGEAQLTSEVTEAMLKGVAQDDEHLRLLKALGIGSVMLVPIRAGGKPIGVLSLVSSQPGRYGPADLKVAEELGRRAGMAIDNSWNFKQAHDAIGLRDEFLSIASHELKTPLTALRLQTELTLRRISRGDAEVLESRNIEKLLEGNSKQLLRLTKLVDDMLDIARISHGKLSIEPEQVDLSELVREVTERFEPQLKARGCVVKLSMGGPVVGLWDGYRLEQVVTNLLTNAMKYAPEKPIEISVARRDDHAWIEVKDHGAGLSAENLERIFGRFERIGSSETVGGLGLGLYISRQIVEAHQGRISARSEPGQGVTFVVELPGVLN